jgi:hypothetical protein
LCFVRVTVLAGFCKSLRTLRADANLVNLPSFSVKSSVKGRFTPFRGSRVGPIVRRSEANQSRHGDHRWVTIPTAAAGYLI